MKGSVKKSVAIGLVFALSVSGPGTTPAKEAKASVIETTAAQGTDVEKNSNCIIDYSSTSLGYVNVKYTESTSKTVKAQVKGPSSTYTYTIRKKEYEVLPLTEGDGTYKVTVFKQASGDQYATVLSASFTVKLKDEFQPYIRPNQYIDYTASTKCVKKADSLCKNAKTDLAKVKKVYKFVVKYFKYDKSKAKTVKSGYLPNLDKVYKAKKGICFDYAATMTAMLRSQGVPVKLVIGYTGKEYHAWVNVYSKKKGWITGAIYINGNKWKLMDPTFASTGGSSKSIMKYINNTKNYKQKYSY